MDDDEDFSSFSSSSKHYTYPYLLHHHRLTTTGDPSDQSAAQFFFSAPRHADTEFADLLSSQTSSWSHHILMEAAKAIADRNSSRVQHLMWMLNELSSPYGNVDQKLAFYFLHALFCRIRDSGPRTYQTMMSASEKNCSFESTINLALKFQEACPWATFGHVACNGAIMEAFEGETKLHIIDFSNTYCTQWPTMIESIANRRNETLNVKLTAVVCGRSSVGGSAAAKKVMKEIGGRMEKFASLMGVPFKFKVIHHLGDLSELNMADQLGIEEDETLAINCVGTLRSVAGIGDNRDSLITNFRKLQPRVVTIVEDEADLNSGTGGFEFIANFRECLRWFRVYFEALDESFPRASNERLALERATGRGIVELVACPPSQESAERRETAARWSRRLHAGGFTPFPFNEEVRDDVRALLRRHKEGWSVAQCSDSAGIFLSWKDQPAVWASAWKP